MAISVDDEDGRRLRQMSQMLHDRRVGRVGNKRYDRTLMRSNSVRPGLDLLAAYHRGDPPLARIHQDWEDYIRRFIRMGRLNIAGLLVSSTQNRMVLRDFRTAAAGDELGDEEARKVMRWNRLKVISREVHDCTLGLGDGYALATPVKGEIARITSEDPRETITVDDPLSGRPKFGLKLIRDEWDSEDHAYVFLPGGKVKVARHKGPTTIAADQVNYPARFDPQKWTWDDDMEQQTPGGRFPLVHFQNEHGTGEFEEHLDVLDRINDKIFNEWWISKIQAFRQRAVINLPDEDEKTGEAINYDDMFTASPDAMWTLPGDVTFWESTPVDMGPIVNSIQKDLERLAAVTSQPLHTITPDAANGSAEGASLMREEHLYKVSDRIDRVDPSWAEVMSLGFAFSDHPDKPADLQQRADVTQIEPMWGPIERFSLEQKASSAAQLKGILPIAAIQTDVLQYPPAELKNLRQLAGQDLLFQAPGQPPAGAPAA